MVSAFSASDVNNNIPLIPRDQRQEHFDVLLSDCLGGYREGETPSSIPNLEAKPFIADNTDPFRVGNVGRRLVVGITFNQNFTNIYYHQNNQSKLY